MPTLSSSYRDGKGRKAEHHARIRAAELKLKAAGFPAKRTRYIAVCGDRDQTFGRYTDACAWLDQVSPATAGRGFTTEDGSVDEGVATVFVRHAD